MVRKSVTKFSELDHNVNQTCRLQWRCGGERDRGTILLWVPHRRIHGRILVKMVWVHTITLTSSITCMAAFCHVQIRVEGSGCSCTRSCNHTICGTNTRSINWILPICTSIYIIVTLKTIISQIKHLN
ncbi:hypothetical protein Hanom_Chr02g00106551 [Helianthus anomalus]